MAEVEDGAAIQRLMAAIAYKEINDLDDPDDLQDRAPFAEAVALTDMTRFGVAVRRV